MLQAHHLPDAAEAFHQLAPVRSDGGGSLAFPSGALRAALHALDRIAGRADCVPGHNLNAVVATAGSSPAVLVFAP